MRGTAIEARGFTLLEILVALAVFGFLLVGLRQALHSGLLAWTAQERLTNRTEEFGTLDRTLRHVIEGADPGDDLDPAPFIGSQDRLDCVTAMPNESDAMGARRMQIELVVDAAHRLVVRWRPVLRAKRLGPPPPLIETELLRGVARLDLAYWYSGGSWVSAWRSPALPTLVRIRLRFPPGDARHWPDIVAAPLLDRP